VLNCSIIKSMFIVDAFEPQTVVMTARAGNHRFGLLSALRAHTKAPYKNDLLRETLRALNRPRMARTEEHQPELCVARRAPRRVRKRPPPRPLHRRLGFGRIGVSEIEAPNMFVNLV
jgi:hypothetical protein